MKNNIILICCTTITIIILSSIIGGCSNSQNENQQLKNKIAQLEKIVNDYKTKELKQNDFSISNDEVINKFRFIENENKLLLLPLEDSRVVRNIQTNTLAKVIDRGVVDGLTWIYVEIPVHDSPIFSKGWIKENETAPYTKDKVRLVQSDVAIIAGAEVYETFKFDDIKKTTPVKLENEDSGRLEEKFNGYARISQAGGRDIWVKESSVIYPGIE